jgi:hypothetical protein
MMIVVVSLIDACEALSIPLKFVMIIIALYAFIVFLPS